MYGKHRKLLLVGVSLLTLALLVAYCAQALAQESQGAQNWRPAAQKRAIQAIITFTWLGVAFVVTLAVGIGGLAIQLWTRVTFPGRTGAILRALKGKRWKVFLVGLVNLVFLSAVFAVCANIPLLGWLAVLVGTFMLALIFLGLLGKHV